MDLSTWPLVALNVTTVAIWLAVLVLIVGRHRSGVRAETKDVAAILISVFFAGVFLPVGPCWWLADCWRTRQHPVPGRPISHERTYVTR